MALDPDIWGDNFLKQGGQPKISGPLGTSQHSLSYASQDYNEPADSVLQSEMLPELNPFMNQRLRCADVPWVKASGTT